MPEAWRDWPAAVQLRINLALLLQRPNGRKIANHLLRETTELLKYKGPRGGSWQRK